MEENYVYVVTCEKCGGWNSCHGINKQWAKETAAYVSALIKKNIHPVRMKHVDFCNLQPCSTECLKAKAAAEPIR